MNTLIYELKIIAKTLAILLLFVLAIITIFLLLMFGGKSHKYYDYNHAKYEGLFNSGWVPEYIPKSSKKIQVVNGATYSAACVKFSIPVSDSNGFLTLLNKRGYKQANDLYEEPPIFGLFYNRCAFDIDDVKHSSSEIYNLQTETVSTNNIVIGRHNTYFALDKSSGTVYYWSLPKRI